MEDLPETLETLTKAGVKELTISHEWSNWQAEFRVFLRAGWKITDSIDLPDYRPGTTRPALLLIHD
ncbi:MAG: hypothetical protein Q4D38_14865 [Planctomycetia bacterium]|nr:hypothetical protein [Planctomycetia bacterium]